MIARVNDLGTTTGGFLLFATGFWSGMTAVQIGGFLIGLVGACCAVSREVRLWRQGKD